MRPALRNHPAALPVVCVLAWSLVAAPIVAQAPTSPLPPTPAAVFGYADFTAQAKIDAQFLAVPDAKLAGQHLKVLTAKPHLAATKEDYETAKYVEAKFKAAGLDTEIVPYRVLLNQPRKVSFEAHADSGALLSSGPTPEHVSTDAFQDDPRVVMPFNGSSGSGDVTGEVVYANYGRLEDFDKLAAEHVDLHGKIVLVRYGANFRGVKVYIAEQRGAVGVLIYSDPQDDGYFKGDAYPNGPWRPETGVQRGSVQYLFKYPGDPQTPGVASTVDLPDSARQDPAHTGNQPNIISVPISYHDAAPILQALKGSAAPKGWQGALPFSYHTGGSAGQTGVSVHLVSDQDYQVRTIWDVIGKIKGSQEPDNWVVVGNHRDAWVYGAVDPSSGTAAMLETVHGLGVLLKSGWKPKRTIVVASWDAEEEGLIGSTEWTEQHAKALEHAVAYFNVDVAVSGGNFSSEAVPSLKQFIREVTKEVPSPKGGSVYDQWKLRSIGENDEANTGHATHSASATGDIPVGDLGSGSDFTPFLQHVGVPSTDIGSSGEYGVYHSVFDNYAWFTMNADPTFVYLQEMARVLGLEALHMADTDVLPYDYVTYASEVTSYIDQAKTKGIAKSLDFAPAEAASTRFLKAAEAVHASQLAPSTLPNTRLASLNTHLRATEAAFIAEAGLPNRSWYKHTIYAPGEFTGYAAVVIPGVNEALEAKNPGLAAQQLIILTQSLNLAAQTLEASVAP